jgi:hypothetical protein
MALPFLPHPSTHWQSRTLCAHWLAPDWLQHKERRARQDHHVPGHVPFCTFAMYSPCGRNLSNMLKRLRLMFSVPISTLLLGFRFAFTHSLLHCNDLRIPFALVLPRSIPLFCSHGTAWLPTQQAHSGMLNLVLSMT